MGPHDSDMVNYSIGTGLSFGRAKNRTDTWGAFKSKFAKPVRTTETLRQYNSLSDKEQIGKKAVNGWFYRTQVQGKRRNRKSGMPTNIVTLDFDYASVEFLEEIRLGLVLAGIEHFVHSSRRHTPEKPRLRIVILLSEPLPNDYYPAVTRILAQQIDPKMEMVDKVSFRPAQMMFMPTVSSDSEYVFEEMAGEPLDWKELLNDFKRSGLDWRNIENLPRCEGEKLRQTADKAEDPTTKTGMVGDFCRAYTVEQAIDRFDLPYKPSTDENRYTYTSGTTSNGMEIYDDGLFCYSHHGSDPACDQLLNAFDLTRIHLFHELDDDTDDETPPGMRPSWKAMVDLLRDDKAYLHAVAESHYDMEAMFDDTMVDPEEESDVPLYLNGSALDPEIEALIGTPKISLPVRHRGAPKDPDWFSKLEIDPRTGMIASNLPNITAILQNDSRFRGIFEYNMFTSRAVTRKPLNTRLPIIAQRQIYDKTSGDPLEDLDYIKVRAVLESPNGKGKVGYGLKVTDRDLWGAVDATVDHWPFHPIQDALASFEWDGVERLETFFIDYLGVEDNAYHREIAVKWFVAGVTRAFEPGHKFDFAIILEGLQGKRKSTMIEIIAMNWFGELKADFHDEKRLVEQMQGCFVMELPELSNFNRSSVEDLKAFTAATKNKVRLSYERQPKTFMRQCIFMGSTNKDTYLLDDTGNRRFWPVRAVVELIDTDKLRREISQIWAEAVDVYRRMRAAQPKGTLHLYLENPESIAFATEEQESRRQHTEADVYALKAFETLDEGYAPDQMDPDRRYIRNEVTVEEIWQQALGFQGVPDRSKQMEIGKTMKKLGWIRVQKRVGDLRVYVYRRPGTDGRPTLARNQEEKNSLI